MTIALVNAAIAYRRLAKLAIKKLSDLQLEHLLDANDRQYYEHVKREYYRIDNAQHKEQRTAWLQSRGIAPQDWLEPLEDD